MRGFTRFPCGPADLIQSFKREGESFLPKSFIICMGDLLHIRILCPPLAR